MTRSTPKQLANLRPFTKNDPRINRQGGKKWLTKRLIEALVKIGEGQSEPYDVLLVKRVMKSAIVDGDMRAIEHIWDRIEGKPKNDEEKGNTYNQYNFFDDEQIKRAARRVLADETKSETKTN